MITSATKLTCPTTTWTLYKNIEDDATGLYKIEYSDYEVKFTLNRTIIYLCFSNYTVQFKTNWSVNATRTDDYYNNYYYNYQRFVGRVTDNCNKQPARGDHIRLKMKIKEETRYLTWYSWENKKLVSEFSYLKKNCDKLYWTNWIETSTCEASSLIIRKRTCMDCDGDALEQIYCDASGDAVDENDCNHYWGSWIEEPCVTTGCNTVGERVRARQCLYDNGREAIIVRLCSDGNESAVMKQKCINNSFSNDCEPQASPGTSKSNNVGLYVGIGMAVALIVILCILLVIVRYRRQKSTHFPQIDIAHQNQTSPYEFANARVETEELLDNVS